MNAEGRRRMPPPFGATKLERALAERIGRDGPMTFAEFMRSALYSEDGYYRGGGRISASGDYFTAPSSHPAFGALLALQLIELWRTQGRPGGFTIVELGAGDGLLARDICKYASLVDPEFTEAADYLAYDTASEKAVHFDVRPLSELPTGVHGCVLSNELLDAMPVHRFVVEQGQVRELYVRSNNGELGWQAGAPSTPLIEERVRPFIAGLPDGYQGEVCLELPAWAETVSKTLRSGHVVTVDYGYPREDLYAPSRSAGSLRCYYRHTLGQDPLTRVGLQDITAHVDFTAVSDALQAAGFAHVGRTSQSQFLHNLGLGHWIEQLRGLDIGARERNANMAGLLQLADSNGMGRFLVDVHSRGVSDFGIRGLIQGRAGLPEGPLPLLADYPGHVDLLGGTPTAGQWFEVPSFEHLFSDEP